MCQSGDWLSLLSQVKVINVLIRLMVIRLIALIWWLESGLPKLRFRHLIGLLLVIFSVICINFQSHWNQWVSQTLGDLSSLAVTCFAHLLSNRNRMVNRKIGPLFVNFGYLSWKFLAILVGVNNCIYSQSQGNVSLTLVSWLGQDQGVGKFLD